MVDELATLERLRREMGLSKRMMLSVLGARPTRSFFFDSDKKVDPVFLQTAQELRRLYDAWRDTVVRQVPEGAIIDVRRLATLLNIPDSAAWALARRFLKDTPSRGGVVGRGNYARVYTLTRDDVLRLFAINSSYLDTEPDALRGPLAEPFVRWCEQMHQQAKITLLETEPVRHAYTDSLALSGATR